ncbi:metal-dependent transcriptional regulator [Candidatus Bathyarchaeota archaeon]|nr:metal-dependent transcriptional regulator [Candidatus Bathyarchaeota archaeon]
MSREVSQSIEEYLENIYRLQERVGCAKTKELAKKMQVTLGTVTNTVELLEREGLVEHRPYRGVKLTKDGRRIALGVIRRHRLAERLLADILHLDWSRVHEGACRLEHVLTEDLAKPLGKILGHPKTCPHGNPIPTRCGGIVEERCKRLIDLKPDEEGAIVKFTEEDQSLLQYLRSLGLMPGVSVKVEVKMNVEDSVLMKLEHIDQPLRSEVTSNVWVRERRGSRR